MEDTDKLATGKAIILETRPRDAHERRTAAVHDRRPERASSSTCTRPITSASRASSR